MKTFILLGSLEFYQKRYCCFLLVADDTCLRTIIFLKECLLETFSRGTGGLLVTVFSFKDFINFGMITIFFLHNNPETKTRHYFHIVHNLLTV